MQKANRLYFIAGILFYLFYSGLQLAAQDTLILIDRQPKIVVLRELNDSMLMYTRVGKQQVKGIERDKVFSINSPGKEPQIVYVQDTLEGNWYTVEQMKDYIRGQQDAQKYYGKRANLAGFTGFVVGVGSAATGLLYGPFVALGYTSLFGFIKPSFKKRLGFNPLMKDNPYYKEGFGTIAKRLSFRRTALGTAIGLAIGLITFTLFL